MSIATSPLLATGQANEQLAKFRDDLDPHAYCEVTAGWIADGATILGGGCGMTPALIGALAGAFGTRRAGSKTDAST